MPKDVILKKNPDIVTRTIDDETILLPIYKSSDEINCIYTLNESASKVWDLIDGKRTLSAIKKEIVEKFDTTTKEVDKQISLLLKDLRQIKALE
ncbi:MAG: PqqD family protein [Candidatus Omnitrophota bacterium]